MKRRLGTVLILALAIVSLTGCGIVKVVPIGEEANYTGEVTFDASAEAADSWGAIVDELTGKAEDLATLKSAGTEKSAVYTVSFSGKVNEYNTDTPKGFIDVSVDGVSDTVHVQIGKVFSGTTVRDSQTGKAYQDFTNQTEWSEYAKTINDNVKTNVIDPLELEGSVGKTVEVIGCFAEDGSGTLVVTPVALTIK